MYSIYRQVFKPCGVENSVYCNFTSLQHKVLIISAASQLTIYKLKDKYQNATEEELTENYQNYGSSSFDGVLEQVGTWSLFGNVKSMKSISMGDGQLDLLLLSFFDGKLSVVEFDLEAYDIKTSSIHYFEESIAQHGMLQNCSTPQIAVDPDNRCAAMLLNNFSVAIIAFQPQEGLLISDLTTHQNSPTKKVTSYDINLKDIDAKTQRVIDIEFLHGYYEPTLLVLYEAPITWSGRVSTRQDTCNIIAISLNTSEMTHPIIWSLNGLPYNCLQVHAVPKPIGGVLVFATSSVLYLNQSVPAYGVSLNGTTKGSTSFALRKQEKVCLQLHGCRVTFLSTECLLVCLANGELYVMTMKTDNMRSIRALNFQSVGTSVQPTSLTAIGNDFVFVGSRLAFPQLIRNFKRSGTETPPRIDDVLSSSSPTTTNNNDDPDEKSEDNKPDDPKSEEKKSEEKKSEEPAAAPVIEEKMEVCDELDLTMYGEESKDSNNRTAHHFITCDSLVNIGPCGAAELGSNYNISDEFANQQETSLELVVLSGHGNNGSLSILQHTLKPQLATSFSLPGCDDMWTVYARDGGEGEKDHHSYLLISREDSTLVLKTCHTEITEVEESGYTMDEPSVFVGNLRSGIVLQVCTASASLLDGTRLLHKINIELDSPIQHCSMDDPHAVLLTANGNTVQLSVIKDDDGLEYRLECSKLFIPQFPPITSVCIYCDRSSMFTTYDSRQQQSTFQPAATTKSEPMDDLNISQQRADIKFVANLRNSSYTDVDDEDELLYGSSIKKEEDQPASPPPTINTPPDTTEYIADELPQQHQSEKTYWLVVIRKNVHLEIYNLVTQKLAFAVPNFAYGRQVLIDCSANYELEKTEPFDNSDTDTECNVLEVCMVGLDKDGQYPYLMARQRDQVLIYKVYSFENTKNYIVNQGLKVRFKKIDHGIMMRKPSSLGDFGDPSSFRPCFRLFNNINGYSGAFLCGPYPHWIVATSRGSIKCHPMNVDGRVSSFAMFHNVNCSHGFIYFNRQSELRIGKLLPKMRYDTDWPMRNISLGCTGHFIVYSIEHKVYTLVTSTMEECKRLPYLNCDNTKDFEDLERDESFIYPRINRFELKLITPQTWQSVPNTSIPLEDFEHVTCMKNVWLVPSAHTTIRNNYVAVGTSHVMGEEMCSRGRILIVEVIEVVPEPGKPHTKNRFKNIYSEEQRGPVSALCGVEGNLLTAIGQKVFIWRFDSDGSLRGLAFVDTNTYITQALNFRSFAIIGDIQRSITLLRYQEEFKTLAVLSRDVKPMEVYCVDLLVADKNCSFVATDSEKNLSYYQFEPQAVESHGGSRLVKRGDIHVGQNVNCMWRVGTVQMDRATGVTNDTYATCHMTMMGTLDGGISSIVPVAEKLYRRLTMLQNYLYTSSPHTAGLNPKEFRTAKSKVKSLSNPVRCVLDGDLLWRYHNLTKVAKHELARKIGSTREQLADDLMELHRSTCVM